MFIDEVFEFFLLGVGQADCSTDQYCGHPWLEFDFVIPWSFWRISLGFFVTEDVREFLVLVRDSFIYLYPSDDGFSSCSSGGEDCFVGVVTLDDDG